jgi:hypothetical protein
MASDLTGSANVESAGGSPCADPKLFLIALRAGRLANRLVLFANVIALAEEQHHRLINFTFHSYAKVFETTRRDVYCQYPVRQRRSLFDVVPGLAGAIRGTRIFYRATRTACVLNERFPICGKKVMRLPAIGAPKMTFLDDPEVQTRIAEARVVFVYDWALRAPAWVEKHADKIRAYFRPRAEFEQDRQTLDRLRQRAEVVVGVHIRHGDYRRWKQGKYYFPASRYAAWMREMAEQFPARKVAFFVCSDEPRNQEEFAGLAVGFCGASPAKDLHTLAGCDYVMGPPSTFSQWASFYGNTPLFHLYDSSARVERERFKVSFLGDIPGVIFGKDANPPDKTQ